MYLSELSVETEIKILYNMRVYTYSEGGKQPFSITTTNFVFGCMVNFLFYNSLHIKVTVMSPLPTFHRRSMTYH